MNLADKVALVIIGMGLVLWFEFGAWQLFAACGLVGVVVGIVGSAQANTPQGRQVREAELVREARARRES